MKSRIPEIARSLARVVPASYGTFRIVQAACFDSAMEAVLFYGNLPARITDAVTNFKMLSQRMNPACSECN